MFYITNNDLSLQVKPCFWDTVAKYIRRSMMGPAIRLLVKRSAAARREFVKELKALVQKEVVAQLLVQKSGPAFIREALQKFEWEETHKEFF